MSRDYQFSSPSFSSPFSTFSSSTNNRDDILRKKESSYFAPPRLDLSPSFSSILNSPFSSFSTTGSKTSLPKSSLNTPNSNVSTFDESLRSRQAELSLTLPSISSPLKEKFFSSGSSYKPLVDSHHPTDKPTFHSQEYMSYISQREEDEERKKKQQVAEQGKNAMVKTSIDINPSLIYSKTKLYSRGTEIPPVIDNMFGKRIHGDAKEVELMKEAIKQGFKSPSVDVVYDRTSQEVFLVRQTLNEREVQTQTPDFEIDASTQTDPVEPESYIPNVESDDMYPRRIVKIRDKGTVTIAEETLTSTDEDEIIVEVISKKDEEKLDDEWINQRYEYVPNLPMRVASESLEKPKKKKNRKKNSDLQTSAQVEPTTSNRSTISIAEAQNKKKYNKNKKEPKKSKKKESIPKKPTHKEKTVKSQSDDMSKYIDETYFENQDEITIEEPRKSRSEQYKGIEIIYEEPVREEETVCKIEEIEEETKPIPLHSKPTSRSPTEQSDPPVEKQNSSKVSSGTQSAPVVQTDSKKNIISDSSESITDEDAINGESTSESDYSTEEENICNEPLAQDTERVGHPIVSEPEIPQPKPKTNFEKLKEKTLKIVEAKSHSSSPQVKQDPPVSINEDEHLQEKNKVSTVVEVSLQEPESKSSSSENHIPQNLDLDSLSELPSDLSEDEKQIIHHEVASMSFDDSKPRKESRQDPVINSTQAQETYLSTKNTSINEHNHLMDVKQHSEQTDETQQPSSMENQSATEEIQSHSVINPDQSKQKVTSISQQDITEIEKGEASSPRTPNPAKQVVQEQNNQTQEDVNSDRSSIENKPLLTENCPTYVPSKEHKEEPTIYLEKVKDVSDSRNAKMNEDLIIPKSIPIEQFTHPNEAKNESPKDEISNSVFSNEGPSNDSSSSDDEELKTYDENLHSNEIQNISNAATKKEPFYPITTELEKTNGIDSAAQRSAKEPSMEASKKTLKEFDEPPHYANQEESKPNVAKEVDSESSKAILSSSNSSGDDSDSSESSYGEENDVVDDISQTVFSERPKDVVQIIADTSFDNIDGSDIIDTPITEESEEETTFEKMLNTRLEMPVYESPKLTKEDFSRSESPIASRLKSLNQEKKKKHKLGFKQNKDTLKAFESPKKWNLLIKDDDEEESNRKSQLSPPPEYSNLKITYPKSLSPSASTDLTPLQTNSSNDETNQLESITPEKKESPKAEILADANKENDSATEGNQSAAQINEIAEEPSSPIRGDINFAKGQYSGELDRKGQPNGKGFYKGSDLTYDGSWVNGKKSGYGRIEYPDGSVYTGELLDDNRHGQGYYFTPNYTHVGDWEKDKKNGQAIIEYTSLGDKYEGNFVDNFPDGKGTFTFRDGSVYCGEFEKGCRHGEGTLTYGDGVTKYEGEWAKDKQTGKAIITYLEGVYEGEVVDGKRQGHGTFTYANGDIYDGEWVNDQKQGKGIYFFEGLSSGVKYRGEWFKGKKHGVGILETKDNVEKRLATPNSKTLSMSFDEVWSEGRLVSSKKANM
ncbi:predicted protein [Naegleria gruberi]|uniref:Predicted protein n=1 Tax=Naegleria gruberi TaxID=5762 RepID=D2VX48_NAEGR|nr:uncharacterized protein NAEGRDRAFT_73617 [Naegleria gruberi]EFC38617.1 predicted protein [Naegleria gruberi]|eukprot:XP_002671361.1 predicted protein [Naegleria gruberi strain NEG-M]